MKLFTKLKGVSRKTLLLSTITAVVLGIGAFHLSSAQAQNINIGGARDCDSNAVVYCGAGSVNQLIHKYNNGDGLNRSGGIKNIFNHFGINQSEVQNMNKSSTHVERGQVSKSGNVYDGSGKLVATNAITAGRAYMPGSTKVTRNGTTFYTRPPSVSFLSNSLEAYVVKVDGRFSYAVLAACGNPVTGRPTTPPKPQPPKPQPKPQPNYDVEKKVKVKGTTEFKKSINVKSGTHVIYSVNVKSTGKAPVKNVVVRDQLPAHVKYVNGTLKRDGQLLTGQANRFFSNGIIAESIAPGTVKHYTFEAIVGPNDTPEKCKDDKLTNVARIKTPGLPEQGSNAVVNKDCPPKPPAPKPQAVACESLQAQAGSRLSYGFIARATAINGAQVTSYTFNFGDGQSNTVTSSALTAGTFHTYADVSAATSYTATVTVNAIRNGQAVSVTAPACAAVVNIAPQPPTPSYAECTSLNLTVVSGRTISATTAIFTRGDATLTSINYDFADGTTLLVNNLQPVSHTFAADGTYVVKATVTFSVAGQNVTSVCQAPIVFATPPTPPCVDNPGTPEDECNPVTPETPVTPDTTTPTGSAGVTELSNTGPGGIAGLVTAAIVAGIAGFRFYLSRRFSS